MYNKNIGLLSVASALLRFAGKKEGGQMAACFINHSTLQS